MDVLSGISRALELRWDFLFRIIASLAGLATLGGLVIRQTPVEAAGALLGWLGTADAADAAVILGKWITERADVLRWVGLGAVVLGVATTSYRSRGAALAVIGASLCAACNDPSPLWIFLALAVLWAGSRAYDEYLWRRYKSSRDNVHGWFSTALAQIPTAVFYLPLAPITWVVNPRPFRL
ncbi:hypothetical protein [Cryobacterium sp. TMB1-7]|uniref:hypothetical protein n=1 Tax=Cryobacterium sp. TMB1-7 TaxID=2555866 RepID=UPI00106C9986|nr:hypothetical protein [Cryobacterium sp. TMB1-7]TFC63101.1 hypothetical protein E3O60_00840 [Cryobacterium sp. TMB1-7]